MLLSKPWNIWRVVLYLPYTNELKVIEGDWDMSLFV